MFPHTVPENSPFEKKFKSFLPKLKQRLSEWTLAIKDSLKDIGNEIFFSYVYHK